jgi:hypothetical protein
MRAKLTRWFPDMTFDNVYDVISTNDGCFIVVDDKGDEWVFPADYFDVVPDEPSEGPAATTSVVDRPEFKPGCGREMSARWFEPRNPAPAPHGAETKPSNPKDVIGSTKPPLSCIPTGPLYEVGAAMLDGSAKYGRHNWRVIGVRSSVYYDAALRHLMKWWEGEDLDADSGCHHLAHAVACCLIVRDAANLGQLTDDRPVSGGDPTAGVKELIKQIKERYPEPVPPFLASQK